MSHSDAVRNVGNMNTRAADNRLVARVRAVRARIRASYVGYIIWRVGITLVSAAIVVIGIVLVPLPGPGWLIVFAGLGLLATEYAWAARLLGFGRRTLAGWTAWVWDQHWVVRALIGLGGLLLIGGLAAAAWWLYLS